MKTSINCLFIYMTLLVIRAVSSQNCELFHLFQFIIIFIVIIMIIKDGCENVRSVVTIKLKRFYQCLIRLLRGTKYLLFS